MSGDCWPLCLARSHAQHRRSPARYRCRDCLAAPNASVETVALSSTPLAEAVGQTLFSARAAWPRPPRGCC
eukprot:2841166-Pleurochrysis_carterae.AAC.1